MGGMLERILQSGFGALRDDVVFLNDVLREYRAVRQTNAYTYTSEDVEVLRRCGQDIRPLTYALAPALAAFYATGRLLGRRSGRTAAAPPRRLLAAGGYLGLRFLVSSYALGAGFYAGSYKQAMDCMGSLAALPTPLGGEICVILRSRDPQHPLLAREWREASGGDLDGRRPRIRADDAAVVGGSGQGSQQAQSGGGAGADLLGTGFAARGGEAEGAASADADVFGLVLGAAPAASSSAEAAAEEAPGGSMSRRERRRHARRPARQRQRVDGEAEEALHF